MSLEYAEIKRLEREIERARIAAEQLEDLNKQLEAEIEQTKRTNGQLKAENRRLEADNKLLRRTVAEAKDPSPVKRASLKRVQALAANACLSLSRLRSGWLLKLGRLERRFRSLGQIWQILIQDNWSLSEVFPPEAPNHQPRLPFRHPVLAPAASACSDRPLEPVWEGF